MHLYNIKLCTYILHAHVIIIGMSIYNDVLSSLHYKSHTRFDCMFLVCGTQHLEVVSMKIL